MYTVFYRASEYLTLPIATAIFFVGFFAAVIAWVANDSRRDEWDRAAALPLNDSAPTSTHAQEP